MNTQTPIIKNQNNLKILLHASSVYFGQCLQTVLLYRSALAIFIVSEAFAYAGFITFWYKAAQSNPDQKLYTPMGLVLYFSLAMFHHSIQHHAASRDLGSDIRLGKLSYAIIRPYPFLLQAVLRSVACTLAYIILLSPLLIGALVLMPSLQTEFMTHISSATFTNYLAALALGLACGWLVRLVVGMLAFDMAQIWGPDTFFIALYYTASGAVFPIDLLPSWALTIAKWTPMYYMVGFPVLTITDRIPAELFWSECGRGFLVLGGVFVLMMAMWRRGIKRFEAIGI
jgi:ABC-2 type transport system permease protein